MAMLLDAEHWRLHDLLWSRESSEDTDEVNEREGDREQER